MSGTAEYRDLFVVEAQENLQALSDGVLKLEKIDHDPKLIHDLFRAAHTLKGMSATMGFEGLTLVCHALEDALESVRAGTQVVTPALTDSILAGVDAMSSMLGFVAAGGDGGPADQALVDRLHGLAQGPATPEEELTATAKGVTQRQEVELPPYEAGRKAVARCLSDGEAVTRIQVTLDTACVFKGVRAVLVRRAIEALGKVLCSWPTGKALEEGAFERSFDLWASSDAVETLETAALRVLEVASAKATLVPPEAFAEGVPKTVLAPGVVDAAAGKTPQVQGSAAALPDTAPLPPGEGAGNEKTETAGRQTLRVSVERLDKVMNQVGELVTAKIRMTQIARRLGSKDMTEALLQVDHIVNDLQQEVTAARMVPMEQVFGRFPRLVRDLSKELGKPLELVIEGREIELDRTILDEIGDALVHLLRNSADHGIEMPEERRLLGKPATGTIRLDAKRDKNQVLISVEDDGRGIDTLRVRQSAVKKGLLSEEAAAQLSEEEAVALIFSPGFSTAAQVTRYSGRGVGIDAVRARAEGLGGSLKVENYPGRGARFRIRLPLTMAIVQALRVRVGKEEYMAPVVNVIEAVEMQRHDLTRTHGLDTVLLRDEVLPVKRLSRILQVPSADEGAASFTVLVVEAMEQQVGLIVDEVLGQQEIAIKSLSRHLKQVRGFGGVTILGDGSVCLILDLATLLDL